MAEEIAKKDTVESLLAKDGFKKRFEEILGKKAPGFISSVISAVKGNANLALCDPGTVLSSAAVAASLDLPINPNLGFAYIVPYSNQAQFQMGWRGFVQLAMRTGQYQTINVSAVCEGELKRHDKFTGEMEFDSAGKKSDNVVGYVAYFRLLNGFEKWFYMTLEEVQAHGKKYSKSFANTAGRWKLDFDAMAKKTVLKLLLSKFGILSIEMQTAIQADQGVINGNDNPDYIDRAEERTQAQEVMERFKGTTDVAAVIPNFISQDKIEILNAMLKSNKKDLKEFLVWAGKETIADFTIGEYPDAVAWIEGKE